MPKKRAARIAMLFPSVLFWLCLFSAAGLFAAVALGPKLVVEQRLLERHREVRGRLVALEARERRMARLAEAAEQDGDFLSELARWSLRTGRPDEQRIAVEPAAPLLAVGSPAGSDSSRPASAARAAESGSPPSLPPAVWYMPWLDRVASDDGLRSAALITAGGLIVIAFGFFGVRGPARA